MSDTALHHIEHLSVTIGPRGSTTEKERQAHDYVQKALTELGFETRREEFLSSTSAYVPFALAMSLMLLSELLFYQLGSLGGLAAAALGGLVVVSVVLELLLKDNPLHWFLPKAPSQNVFGVAPARDGARRRIVIAAHADTHRTGLLWKSPATFGAYRVLSTLGVVSLLAAEVIFVVGIFAYGETLRAVSLVPAAFFLILLLMVLQAHFTRYTAGANDNASGVGVMLSLARRLKDEPLDRSEVWLLSTGCEEVGAYGMRDFVDRHADELRNETVLVVDNVAGKDTGAVYLRSENFALAPFKYPPDLLALADRVAADRPELNAYSAVQNGAYTDGAIALNAGLKALTFVGYTRKGWIPNWHNVTDTFARVDPKPLDQTEAFVWEVMKRLDSGS